MVMEELNNKLLSKDPTVIALIISKLVEYIQGERKKGKEEILELSFLKIKCVSPDTRINEIAAKGILKLVGCEIVQPTELLEEFISLIPNSNQISRGIVKAISGVLYYQLCKESEKFIFKYNLSVPQHPLISLYINDSECLPYIYNEIKYGCLTQDICSAWHTFNYPLYQFCMCNPTNKKSNYYQTKLWINLIETNMETSLVTKLISWMLFDSTGSMIITSELLNELSMFHLKKGSNMDTQILLSLQVSSLYHLVCSGNDPRNTLESIELMLTKMHKIHCVNPVLLILAKTITRSSPVYVLEILQICEILTCQPNVNFFILETVRVSLLHWIGNPSILSSEVVNKASEIHSFIQNNVKKRTEPDVQFRKLHKKFETIIISNQELDISFKLAAVCESWNETDSVLEFLRTLMNLGANFIGHVIHLVFGLFVCDLSCAEITLTAFEVICVYIENFKEYSNLTLTLILFKLSNTSESNIHFKLLKYLPKLAGTSENYLKVVTTIKVLFSGSEPALKTLGMSLMYDLWSVDSKAYHDLEDMLTSTVEDSLCRKWEYYVNKAHIIKKLCENNPIIYGEDMVAHLSKILSKCSGGDGDLASSISLEAITVLCRAGIIEVGTTWATLAPKFVGDDRPQTIKSLCDLMSAIADLLDPEQNAQHSVLQKEVICKLWDYTLENQDPTIKRAALNALAEFGLENISPHFPEQYITETSNNSEEDLKTLLVRGHCWVEFLKNQSDLHVAGDFLIKMIGKEIDEYLKSVYHVTSMKEPINYSYLPSHSIVRGIAEHCRLQVRKCKGLHEPVYVECMRILSQQYSKPLPPYNWCFLQELFHEPKLKNYCITLASHQVMISGTARRFMENYIDGLVSDFKNVEGVLLVYTNLKFLTNSIQPMILGPFFNNTLNYGKYLLKEEHNCDLITSIIKSFKEVLIDPTVQEANKKGIVASIDEKLESVDISDEMFHILLNCVVDYPSSYLQNITKLPEDVELTTDIFHKAVKFRCFLALNHEDKLKWLNDLIDFGSRNPTIGFPLKDFFVVFIQQKCHTGRVKWTYDLVGRIEAALGSSNNAHSLLYLLDILVVALVVFSGLYIFLDSNFKLEEYLMFFPQSTAVLMMSKEWFKCSAKIMECIYYLNLNSKGLLPHVYQNIFGLTLQALRHHSEFKKNNNWMKYMNASIILNKNS